MGSFSKANCKFKGELQIFKGELPFAPTSAHAYFSQTIFD